MIYCLCCLLSKLSAKKIQMQITKILIKQVFYSNTIFFLILIFPPLTIPDQVRSWDPGLRIRVRFCSAPDPRNQIQDSITDGRFLRKKRSNPDPYRHNTTLYTVIFRFPLTLVWWIDQLIIKLHSNCVYVLAVAARYQKSFQKTREGLKELIKSEFYLHFFLKVK